MGRKIICPGCNTIFDEDILKQKNSENTCLVCGASLSGDDSHTEGDKPQTEPEEELITWYYYKVGKNSHYLDDKYTEDSENFHLVYQFQAPKDLEKAKEVLRKEYKPDAFAEPENLKYKLPQKSESQNRCPRCGSHDIQLIQRKWSIWTGFRTNAVDKVCVNCKYRW